MSLWAKSLLPPLPTLAASVPQTAAAAGVPGHFEIRRVGSNGCISWNSQWLHLTQALADQDVGLEETDDGIWSIHFGPMLLGRFHQGEARLRGVHA